jgi:hypothetical protein
MSGFRIFTESKGDIVFLKHFIEEVYHCVPEKSLFEPLGSWSGYKTGGVLNTLIQQNFDNGNKTVLILDADNNFEKRKEEVLNDFRSYGIPVDLFLFPNNSRTGNMETILAEIAVQRKIMDCFLNYEKCVGGHPKPLNDSRIYSYLNMVLYPNPFDNNNFDLRKDKFRNYRIRDHWDLHHNCIKPLKEFLKPYF